MLLSTVHSMSHRQHCDYADTVDFDGTLLFLIMMLAGKVYAMHLLHFHNNLSGRLAMDENHCLVEHFCVPFLQLPVLIITSPSLC